MNPRFSSSHRPDQPDLIASFQRSAMAPVTGKLREGEMTFTRVGLNQDHDGLHVQSTEQNAFYVVFQLREYASHDHWVDGRHQLVPSSPRGSVHIADLRVRNAAVLNGRFDSLNLLLTHDLLAELAEDIGAPPIENLSVPEDWQTQDTILAQLQPSLLGAIHDPGSVSSYFIDHLAVTTALHIAERYGRLRRAVLRPGALAPWQEKRAREIIAANLAKEVSLAEVASECGLSVAHFSRAFKASVGMTPHGWLQASRLDRARALLRNPGNSFAEVALACGFADQSHFSRIFKRATGSTPGEWRRLRRG